VIVFRCGVEEESNEAKLSLLIRDRYEEEIVDDGGDNSPNEDDSLLSPLLPGVCIAGVHGVLMDMDCIA